MVVSVVVGPQGGSITVGIVFFVVRIRIERSVISLHPSSSGGCGPRFPGAAAWLVAWTTQRHGSGGEEKFLGKKREGKKGRNKWGKEKLQEGNRGGLNLGFCRIEFPLRWKGGERVRNARQKQWCEM